MFDVYLYGSHPATKSSQKIREDLGAPIEDKVFFAGIIYSNMLLTLKGEAIHPTSYMTLGGAIDTGLTAAKAVLQSLERKPTAKL